MKQEEKLEEAKRLYKDANADQRYVLESEDEKIRKWLITQLELKSDVNNPHDLELMILKSIAWLEKQAEQKPKDKYTFNSIPRLLDMIKPTGRAKAYCQKLIDSLLQEGYTTDAKIVSDCLKQMNGENVAMATMDEHKLADKVEPKFKVGDWTVSNLDGKARQISEVHFDEYNSYYVVDGKSVNLEEYDRLHHLWTIKDAKDGDILVVENIIFIYKRVLANHIVSYCKLINDVFEPTVDARTCCECNTHVHPATKEQRDILFAKMKEASYEWDAEKKIEIKQGEQKPAWSEEDEEMWLDAIKYLELFDAQGIHGNKAVPCINWLKSLKPQKHWKPSKDQIGALNYAYCELFKREDVGHNVLGPLQKLCDELKKLREE